MKSLVAVLLLLASVSFTNGLVLVENDIRDILPIGTDVTVYFVGDDWFIAEAPDTWGTALAESAEGLYVAHLADPDAAVPGTVIFSRDGVAIFEAAMPLPLSAHEGIRLITPLRPYDARAFLTPSALPFGQNRDLISDIIDQLQEDSLKSHIQNLQDFETRLCITPQFFESALWVADKFESYGLESVEVDTFDFTFYGEEYESANVQAELPGTLDEPGIVLITGHLDAITYGSPYTFAPGADDNASGCATVLEAARIMSQYEFPNTVRFVCFGAEELGLIGSEYYAENAFNAGENIVAVMNLDMILYGPETNRALFVPYDSQSEFISTMFERSCGNLRPRARRERRVLPGNHVQRPRLVLAEGLRSSPGHRGRNRRQPPLPPGLGHTCKLRGVLALRNALCKSFARLHSPCRQHRLARHRRLGPAGPGHHRFPESRFDDSRDHDGFVLTFLGEPLRPVRKARPHRSGRQP